MFDVLAIKWYCPSSGFGFGSISLLKSSQNLCHLVFHAHHINIDNDISVRPLCDLVLCHSFSVPKPPGIAAVPPFAIGKRVSGYAVRLQAARLQRRLVGRSWHTDSAISASAISRSLPSERRTVTIESGWYMLRPELP